MKIVFGQGVADGRGKLGGTVFSRNASGAYARKFVKPVNPNTAAQQLVRSRFALLASSYRGLTAGQRNSFVVQAPNYPQQDKIGNTITLTGQQLFNKMNMAVTGAGSTVLIATAPPPLSELPEVVNNPVALIDDQNVLLDVQFRTTNFGVPTLAPAVPTGFRAVLEATRALSPGYDRLKDSDYKQITTYPAAAEIPNLGTGNYDAVFGSFIEGSLYYYRIFLVSTSTGQRTPAVSQSFIYTTTP